MEGDKCQASLARQYAERVEVACRGNRPDQFLWRGRPHRVRAVLDHWVVTGSWWEGGGEKQWEGASAVEEDERQFWRVEAAVGQGGGLAVVDLCHAVSTGTWSVHDLFD